MAERGLNSKKVIVMQGRFQLYEEYSFAEVTFLVRVLQALGIHTLTVSYAAEALVALKSDDIFTSKPTLHFEGGGCC